MKSTIIFLPLLFLKKLHVLSRNLKINYSKFYVDDEHENKFNNNSLLGYMLLLIGCTIHYYLFYILRFLNLL